MLSTRHPRVTTTSFHVAGARDEAPGAAAAQGRPTAARPAGVLGQAARRPATPKDEGAKDIDWGRDGDCHTSPHHVPWTASSSERGLDSPQERYGMTHMRQLSNRVKFGEEEDMTSDGMLGVGMLGKAQQTGKVRGGGVGGGGGRVVPSLTPAIVRRSASVRRSRSFSPSATRRRGPQARPALPTASRRRLRSRPSRRVHTTRSHHLSSPTARPSTTRLHGSSPPASLASSHTLFGSGRASSWSIRRRRRTRRRAQRRTSRSRRHSSRARSDA